jgi:hypothetical protein
MSKYDLWKDCQYWPKHRFKKNVCIACGFKKPQPFNPVSKLDPAKSSLECRIDKILLFRQEIASFDYGWMDYAASPADVYDGYTVSGCFGDQTLMFPSSPLKGEKKREKRKLNKVAKAIEFYEKTWPLVRKTLDEILTNKNLKPIIRGHVEMFLRSLIFFDDTLTRHQTEQLVAAYTYYYLKLPERQIAEEPDSLFPHVTRKTLRKWVGFVKRFEYVSLG